MRSIEKSFPVYRIEALSYPNGASIRSKQSLCSEDSEPLFLFAPLPAFPVTKHLYAISEGYLRPDTSTQVHPFGILPASELILSKIKKQNIYARNESSYH